MKKKYKNKYNNFNIKNILKIYMYQINKYLKMLRN